MFPELKNNYYSHQTLRLEHAEQPNVWFSAHYDNTASPSTVGKEMANVAARLSRQLTQIEKLNF